MKELVLLAEIIFLETAKNSFNFPIINSVRLSLWFPEGEASTFSEIQIQEKHLEIGKPQIVKIKLMSREFLKNKIIVGSEFKMGTFANAIALGKIVEVEGR